MSVFLVVSLIFVYYPRKRVILLLLIVLSSVVVDVVRTTATGASGGVERGVQLGLNNVGIEKITQSWINLVETTQHKLGSIFGNFIILMLGLYWLLQSDLKIHFNLFLAIFLSIGILPSLFSNWIIQHRIFYDIPFQIPAAIALTYIMREKKAF